MRYRCRKPHFFSLQSHLQIPPCSTIMPADRVVAFDAGEVVDFDAPSALLHITRPEEAPRFHPRSGVLVELVGRAGPGEEDGLRAMAAAGFLRRRLLVRARSRKGAVGGSGWTHALSLAAPSAHATVVRMASTRGQPLPRLNSKAAVAKAAPLLVSARRDGGEPAAAGTARADSEVASNTTTPRYTTAAATVTATGIDAAVG